jgi:hypothetical protein
MKEAGREKRVTDLLHTFLGPSVSHQIHQNDPKK